MTTEEKESKKFYINRFSDFSIDTLLQTTPQNSDPIPVDVKNVYHVDCSSSRTDLLMVDSAEDLTTETFQWLQYSRFKPPKVDRRRETRKKEGGHRNPRIPFTGCQVSILESKFRQTKYLSSLEVRQLSKHLQITDARVKIWFQNRRAREKRERQSQVFQAISSLSFQNFSTLGSFEKFSALNFNSLYDKKPIASTITNSSLPLHSSFRGYRGN